MAMVDKRAHPPAKLQTKLRKRKASSDDSDDDAHDAELEKLIAKRLEAHCGNLFSDEEHDDQHAAGDSTDNSGDAATAADELVFGPQNKKRRKVEAKSVTRQYNLRVERQPEPSERLPETDDDWTAILGSSKSAPDRTAGTSSGPAKQQSDNDNSRGVVVVDATKYSTNPVARAAATDRKRFLSADVLKVHEDKSDTAANKRGRPKKPKETFREQLAREIEELGASTLTGRAKKEHEIQKIMRLGGKAPKNMKTPIKILNGMKKKEGERAQKKKEESINTGMHVKKKKSRTPISKKSRGLDLTSHAGTFSGGVLRVKPSLIAKISRSKK